MFDVTDTLPNNVYYHTTLKGRFAGRRKYHEHYTNIREHSNGRSLQKLTEYTSNTYFCNRTWVLAWDPHILSVGEQCVL